MMTTIDRELFAELVAAHTIIRNALAVMTTAQKLIWAEQNEHDGVSGEGITRANERAALIDLTESLEREGGAA